MFEYLNRKSLLAGVLLLGTAVTLPAQPGGGGGPEMGPPPPPPGGFDQMGDVQGGPHEQGDSDRGPGRRGRGRMGGGPRGPMHVLGMHGVALSGEETEICDLIVVRHPPRMRGERPDRKLGQGSSGPSGESTGPGADDRKAVGGMLNIGGKHYGLFNVTLVFEENAGKDEERRDGPPPRRKITAITADLVETPKMQDRPERGEPGERPEPKVLGKLEAKIGPKVAAMMGDEKVVVPFLAGTATVDKGEWKVLGRVQGGPPHKGPRRGGQGPDGEQDGPPPGGPQQGGGGGGSEGGPGSTIDQGF